MMMRRFVQFVACMVLPGAMAFAQAPTALEPGQAEAQTSETRVTDVPTTWTSPAKEARAIWITGDELMKPREEVLAKLDALADTHFNAVFLDTYFRGYVIYPGSALVPQNPQAAPMGDILKWVVDEAHKRGLQVHNWPEYGCYAYHTMDAKADKSRGALLDKHPELTAKTATGATFLHNDQFGDFYSLCPANPESFKLLSQLYVEMMTRYNFDGLNLDRMRFPSHDYCYCDYCKEHFKKDTGLDLVAFDKDTTGAAKFLDWKRHKLADGVEMVVKAVRAARPDANMTAYVVGPDEMDEKAQSWDLWVKRGLLDAIGVSMYGPDIRPTVVKAKALLGDHANLLVAAINAGLPDTSFLLRNIGYARESTPLGQFMWYAADAMDDLDELKAGPYEQKAEWPLP